MIREYRGESELEFYGRLSPDDEERTFEPNPDDEYDRIKQMEMEDEQ